MNKQNMNNKIAPLYKLPVNKTYKNNNFINKINLSNLSLNKIISLYIKTFNLYNNNYISYLHKNNNLDLILQVKNEASAGSIENLNIKISSYFYTLKKLYLKIKINSLLYNINLFLPNSVTSVKAIAPSALIKDSSINTINELLEQGNKIINELNYQITLKKNIITRIKNNEVIELVDSLLPNTTKQSIKNTSNLNNNSLSFAQAKSLEEVNTFSQKGETGLISLFKQNLAYNKLLNTINKSNEIKIEQTLKAIAGTVKQEINYNIISPVAVDYTLLEANKKPIINKYIKSMSIYNMNTNQSLNNNSTLGGNKGGIIIYYSNIIGYNFNSNINKLIKNSYNLISASFKAMYTLISKPVFVVTSDKIIIQLFYYIFIPNILKLKKIYKAGSLRRNKFNNLIWKKRKANIKKLFRKFRKMNVTVRIHLRKLSNLTLTKVYPERFEILCEILSKYFKKPVELDLIRLHYPYNDSHILVNLLGIMINKIKLRIILRRLFEKAVIKNINKLNTNNNIIPSFLSGISIKIAGRLLTQKVVPRQTINITRRGSLSKGKINFLDTARFTNKNKRGAFSVTITSSQNYF